MNLSQTFANNYSFVSSQIQMNMYLSFQEDLCESIIEAYVTYLIKSKHKSLVAHYVSMLKLDSQVQWYASFLEGNYLVVFT